MNCNCKIFNPKNYKNVYGSFTSDKEFIKHSHINLSCKIRTTKMRPDNTYQFVDPNNIKLGFYAPEAAIKIFRYVNCDFINKLNVEIWMKDTYITRYRINDASGENDIALTTFNNIYCYHGNLYMTLTQFNDFDFLLKQADSDVCLEYLYQIGFKIHE